MFCGETPCVCYAKPKKFKAEPRKRMSKKTEVQPVVVAKESDDLPDLPKAPSVAAAMKAKAKPVELIHTTEKVSTDAGMATDITAPAARSHPQGDARERKGDDGDTSEQTRSLADGIDGLDYSTLLALRSLDGAGLVHPVLYAHILPDLRGDLAARRAATGWRRRHGETGTSEHRE